MLSDTEIFKCSGVRLIFLGQTHYGILPKIKQPSPGRSLPTPTTALDRKPLSAKKEHRKTTCSTGT